MCPMLDMINHDHGARPRFSYDARQDVFSVAADRNYPKGQQVASLPLCLLKEAFVSPKLWLRQQNRLRILVGVLGKKFFES